MQPEVSSDRFQEQMLQNLDETFESVHGIYLDRGTSVFETLAQVSAAEASQRASGKAGSIAAHVKHMALYLRVLQVAIRGEDADKTNWREIWEEDRPVTPTEWSAAVEELRGEYRATVDLLKNPSAWGRDDAVGGFIAVASHTAYHLGAIRQALAVIRSRSEK